MKLRVLCALAALPLSVPVAAAAGTWTHDLEVARKGLARAAKAHRITAGAAADYRRDLAAAASVHERTPPLRARLLERVLGQVADAAPRYTAPRALTLFSMLAVNARYLAAHRVPAAGSETTGPDGVVYRAFPGKGLQFHPPANAGKLNAHVAAGREDEAAALARALLARGVKTGGGGLALEYWFPVAGEPDPPWRSGMAQAVAAQAIARAGELTGDRSLVAGATRMYRAVRHGLTLRLDRGPWIALYGGTRQVVLNAQLQSAISIGEYARISGNASARLFAGRLREAAARMLPRFDTGYWTRYSLGTLSSLHYQRFVVDLLRRLGDENPAFAKTATRFAAYEQQDPILKARPAPVLYPRPRDGFRDEAQLRIWLSKPSRVILRVDGHAREAERLGAGWQTLAWRPKPSVSPGEHDATLFAHGPAGNIGSLDLAPLEIRRDTTAPALSASTGKGRIWWSARDGESPRVRLFLVVRRGGHGKTIPLGTRRRGSYRLGSLPPGRWWGILRAVDGSGNARKQALGRIS